MFFLLYNDVYYSGQNYVIQDEIKTVTITTKYVNQIGIRER